jgi:hypothetical protein
VCDADEQVLPAYQVELLDRRRTIEVGDCALEASASP